MTNPSARFDITANSRVAGAFSQTRSQMAGMRRDMGRMTRGVRDNRRVIQQAGMQLSDFAVQVGGGQNAILAFTQNVPQFVQGFGAIGGVLAALITVGGTLALVMTKTGTSLNDLTPIAGILADELQTLATWFYNLKEAALDTINVVVNNLDRMLGALTAIVAFLTVKWVAGWILATGVVNAMSAAFVLLRRMIILTGWGALIVAIGTVGWYMVKLVEATGGWGAALEALGRLAQKAWDGIRDSAVAMGKGIQAMWYDMRATFADAIAWMAQKWADFVAEFGGGVNAMSEMMGGGEVIDVMGTAAWASSFEAAGVRFKKTADGLRADAQALSDGAFAPMVKELQTLLDMMNAVDMEGEKIDVRDWFGGSGDGDGGGKGKAGGKSAKDSLTQLQERMKALGDTIKSSVGDSLMAITERTKTVAEAFRDMAKDIIKQLYDVLVVQRLVGSFNPATGVGTGITGFLTKGLGSLLSFNGGGFTGHGSRSGGVDGKGGFPAVLHPNETVIDHSKGGGSAGGTIVQQSFDFRGAESGVEQKVMAMMPNIVNATMSAVLDKRKRGGSFAKAFG